MSKQTQSGGKFIASGSFGCVHYPHLQCLDGKVLPKSVGKVFFDHRDMDEELRTNVHVQKVIDPDNRFTIPLVGQCKVKKFLKSDQFDLCPTPQKDANPQHYYQLLYPHAGKSVFDIITKKYKSQSTLTKHFLEVFLGMHSILDGLEALNKHQYIHADIKLDNLMMKDKRLYLIDFGISQPERDFYSTQNIHGALSASQVYYPPEFKVFIKKHNSFDEFHNDFLMAWKYDQRLYDILKSIHADVYDDDMIHTFKMSRRAIQNHASKADTFSLGIELLELLLICRIPQTVSNRNKKMTIFIDMYLNLIKGMTRLDPKARLSVPEIKHQYKAIVKHLQRKNK